jgi:organic radical activating enzyme
MGLLSEIRQIFSASKPVRAVAPEISGSGLERRDGIIFNQRQIEVSAAKHCNLTCRSCSHLSPLYRKANADIESVSATLRLLAKSYRARTCKILGGEPLLHPQLPDLIDAIRRTGICDRILIATNGVLLPRMPAEFWARIDEVTVSMYPGHALDDETILRMRETAEAHGVILDVSLVNNFRYAFSQTKNGSPELVDRIFRTCQIAHVWRCHTVENGRFYRCPPSVFIPEAEGDPAALTGRDGLLISDDPAFGDELWSFLTRSEPLDACANCLGTVGALHPHNQAGRQGWGQSLPPEFLVDMDYLAACERDLRASRPASSRVTVNPGRRHRGDRAPG